MTFFHVNFIVRRTISNPVTKVKISPDCYDWVSIQSPNPLYTNTTQLPENKHDQREALDLNSSREKRFYCLSISNITAYVVKDVTRKKENIFNPPF